MLLLQSGVCFSFLFFGGFHLHGKDVTDRLSSLLSPLLVGVVIIGVRAKRACRTAEIFLKSKQ